jgi:hypothetical protein
VSKKFQQIQIGETFLFTEGNTPQRFIKATSQLAMKENGDFFPLGSHVEVLPETDKQMTREQVELINLIEGHMGGDVYYRHALVRFFYHTQGIQDLASTAECFWLVDAIASWQMTAHVRRQPFQCWKLEKRMKLMSPADLKLHIEKGWTPATEWILRCTDGGTEEGERELCRQHILYCTFPLDEISIWVENGTSPDGKPCKVLLLPTEH